VINISCYNLLHNRPKINNFKLNYKQVRVEVKPAYIYKIQMYTFLTVECLRPFRCFYWCSRKARNLTHTIRIVLLCDSNNTITYTFKSHECYRMVLSSPIAHRGYCILSFLNCHSELWPCIKLLLVVFLGTRINITDYATGYFWA